MMKLAVMLSVFCIMLLPIGTYAGDQNVNVNININQSQGYSGGSCVAQEPGGYKIVYSHVHEFQGGYPIDIPLPGVDDSFLRLKMEDGSILCGEVSFHQAYAEPRELVTADQINRDRPALPCIVWEFAYRAVDRDGSLLGVMVTMVTPRLWECYNTATQWNNMKMNPVLRVTIWRKE